MSYMPGTQCHIVSQEILKWLEKQLLLIWKTMCLMSDKMAHILCHLVLQSEKKTQQMFSYFTFFSNKKVGK